jgi:peptidyl-prolyl cis-trans isomerase A (cyclophilin A)
MKNTFLALSMLFLSFGAAMAQTEKAAALEPGLYAQIETAKGNIVIWLEAQKTPMTVANFVGLAEGNFTNHGKVISKPFYDGLKFHRVINDFMIQGGDPAGNGSGGPDYKFPDEIHPDLKHTGPGILSMANSGPATNGSQFFITHKATPWLDGKHTVFGHVVSGMDVVNQIVQDDVMTKVTILRIGKDAKNFNATQVFEESIHKAEALEAEKKAKMDKIVAMSQDEYKAYFLKEVQKKFPKAKQTASGLVYVIDQEGTGPKPEKGSQLSVHYTGTFMDGGLQFDSSRDRGAPMDFGYKVNPMVPGFEEANGMLGKGGKGKFFIPYYSAYGAKGRAGGIPPYSDLVFDLEMMNITAPAAPAGN